MRFEHTSAAQRVVLASGEVRDVVHRELERGGWKAPMVIVSDREEDRLASLGLRMAATFTEVAQHVPAEVVERAREVAGSCGADALVSFGGGSTVGLAKAIALDTGLPIIAIPTTYAGSEATEVWGITRGSTKTTGADPVALPRTVIYDAELTLSLPRELSVVSGLNALAHCVDSLWAPKSDPLNRVFALEGARALASALPRINADPHDLGAREEMLYGTYLAGRAFSSATSGIHHKICHVLGGTFDLPHAPTHAVVLPHVLALNEPCAPELGAALAQALGSPASSATVALNALYDALGAPRSLAKLGFAAEDVPVAVRRVVPIAPASNPAPVTAETLTALLTAALVPRAPEEH